MKTIKHVKSARILKILFCTMLLTILCTLLAWAGTWEPTEYNGYQYKNEDGTYLTATWLQDNGKWYFFDEQGLLVVNSVVEGYQLGADGAEVTGAAEITRSVRAGDYTGHSDHHRVHSGCGRVCSDHGKDCSLRDHSNRDEVIAQGYVPCKRCNP